MMASAQVVEKSVNTNNIPSQDSTTNPDDHSNHNIDSPGFKPFTVIYTTFFRFGNRFHRLNLPIPKRSPLRLVLMLPRPTVPIQTLYTKVTPTIASIDITQETVRKYIETLNPQKATGPDGISPKLLKFAGQSVTAPLTVIFNQRLRETSVPSTWKCARIKTTHKKGDITERENYRPLSILSVPSKIWRSA